MSSRKIFNYKSEILKEETFQEFGYYPDKYGEKSAKFVMATCRYCGKAMKIHKSFFNNAGSACHKECKIQEMKRQKSPFSDPAIQKKAQKKIEEKYGPNRKLIGEKISQTMKSEKSREKFKNTCLERYGVENVFQSEEIKKKLRKTNKKKYGFEHPMKNAKVRQRAKDTMMNKFGVENPMQDKFLRKKAEETNLERYGCSNPMQNKEIKAKAVKTNEERYGVGSPLQNPDILKKMVQTNLEKYGNSCPMQNPDILNQIKENNLKKWGHENPFGSKEIRGQINKAFKEVWGVEYPSQNNDIKQKMLKSFENTVKQNRDGKYDLINTLRGDEDFWEFLSRNSLLEAAEEHSFLYSSLRTTLLREEFIERYREVYKRTKSRVQKTIYGLIKEMLGEEIKVMLDTRKIISPFELDIYVPEKNFAIEFNGSYWHSEGSVDKKEAATKHRGKLDICREKDIRLFQIFEHHWRDREKQILNFIKTILGVNKIKIPARKCIITNSEQRQFMNDNHIQGYGVRTIKWFNLEHDGNLVASMTASSHHRQNSKGNPIVLNRLCFQDGVNVQGGSSKLFKVFKKWAREEGYDRIISWSDNCWTEGGIYRVLGFELENESGPDYFYWDSKNDRYVSKQSQKKSSTGCPPEITERDWCFQRGLYRIWDCGKKTWRYDMSATND